MADSILKLKVDSQEYDSKLKNATQGLLHLERSIRQAGDSFQQTWKEEQDFIRGLGSMETSSNTARGRVRELTSAFTELSAMYKRMSSEERATPAGKAMAESISQLQTRVVSAKSDLDDINRSISGGGGLTGALEGLTSKFGVSINQLAGWGTAIAAAKGALNVAMDAFMASESNVDDWNRLIASSESVYNGFLNALNNGDISGYLNNIDSIIKAAQQAYDELDKLGTMKTIQGPRISAQQTENERMRMMIQTGRYIAPVDGRKPTMKDGQLLTKSQIHALEKHLQNGVNSLVKLHEREVKQTSKAIDAYYNKLAKENGMSLNEFRKGTSSWAEFSKRMDGYSKYLKFEKAHSRTITTQTSAGAMTTTVRDAARNPYAQYRNWGNFRVDKQGSNSQNDLVNLIKQRDQQASQVYSMQSQAYRSINRAEGITVRNLMGRGGSHSSGGKETPAQKATNKVLDAERTYNETIQKAAIRMEAGLDDTLAYKKKELSAQERLFDAYSDAYNIYKNPAIKEKQKIAAEEIGKLSTEIKKETENQRASQEAARKLEAEQKKAADALAKRTALEESWKTPTLSSIGSLTQDITSRRSESAIGSAEFSSLSANLVDITSLNSIINTSLENGISIDPAVTQSIMQQIVSGTDIDDSVWEDLVEQINKQLAKLDIAPIQLNFKTGNIKQETKEMNDSWKSAAQAVQAVGGALSSIEDPAAKIMGTVAQAIATIALAYAEASLQAAKNPANAGWGWIAFAATGLATMFSTIAAVHSATGYANGGMIKGNTYSGDQLMAQGPDGGLIGLNAGEIVLNKAAQGNLASQLNDNSNATPRLVAEVSAEQIRFVIRNNRRRENISETALFR